MDDATRGLVDRARLVSGVLEEHASDAAALLSHLADALEAAHRPVISPEQHGAAAAECEDERNALRSEVENLRGGYAASTEALDRFRDVVCEVTGYRENPGDDTMIAKLRSMHGLTGPEPTRWREFMVGARAARDQIIAHAAGAARHMERLTPTWEWCHARHACHHWWEDECSEACDRGEHAHPHGAAECSDRRPGGNES